MTMTMTMEGDSDGGCFCNPGQLFKSMTRNVKASGGKKNKQKRKKWGKEKAHKVNKQRVWFGEKKVQHLANHDT